MLTLKIQNPEIETIFLEGFNSNHPNPLKSKI